MIMIKKTMKQLGLGFFLLLHVSQGSIAESAQKSFTIYLFWAEGCPHCAREIEFMRQWVATEPRLRVYTYEITREPRNRELYSSLVQYFGIRQPAVPFIVIGFRYIQGFVDEATTGRQIKAAAAECLKASCGDLVQWLQTVNAW